MYAKKMNKIHFAEKILKTLQIYGEAPNEFQGEV